MGVAELALLIGLVSAPVAGVLLVAGRALRASGRRRQQPRPRARPADPPDA